MKGTPTSERYPADECVDCETNGRAPVANPGKVMRRQVASGIILPLCPEHADMRRATGGQSHGSQPPRRLRR